MTSRIFAPNEDDNLDEIFNLDDFGTQFAQNARTVMSNQQSCSKNMEARGTFQAAFQTPKIDNVNFDEIISSDSAVGSESLGTMYSSELFNCMMSENVEGQGSSVGPSLIPEVYETFISTQYGNRVPQLLSSTPNDHSPNDNYAASFNSSLPSNSSLAKGTSLADLSFYSLMAKDLPSTSTSTQLDMTTQDNQVLSPFFRNSFGDGDDLTQHRTWSGYLTAPRLTENEPQHTSQRTLSIPQSILDLHTQVMGSGLSDWSFVYALSAQMCQEFMPMSYNVTLKESLLLSIVSINSESHEAPIPIMAFGHDFSSANAIMSFMGNFAQRFLTPTDHMFNVTIDSERLVEVGPLFLAKNGVCFLGDWSVLPNKFLEEIKTLTDSGRYFLNETSESIPLSSAVWTYCSLMEKNIKNFANVAMFTKYFGIPIEIDSRQSDDVMEYLLVEARDGKVDIPNDVLNIKYEDMKNYLNIVRKMEVRKTEEAQTLLKLYFKSIQTDRKGLLSPRSFQIIQQMADSFAKLSMRDKVLPYDVVSAIAIAEKTFYAITGIARAPLLPSTQDIEKVDDYIQVFHRWVFNYVNMSKI